MAEYIEREKVMQAFSDYVWHSNHSDFVPAPRWNDAVDIVRDIPAAAVRPFARGKWIRQTDTRFGPKLNDIIICSVCNIAFSSENQIRRSFCPNCGADMRDFTTDPE